MTRTLPWLKRPGTGTAQATRSPRSIASRSKRRRRIVEPSSDVDGDNEGVSRGEKALSERASPSTLGPPSESSMHEGLDKDDSFRMVEDEFLDMAKQFTQHLHAAEYQRLKKAARSQNAAVIHSISRPVSIRMPDETRRKVQSVARAKKQAAAVQGLVRKQDQGSGSDEGSDSNGGAWLGTALHGLMESPRRSAASLTKFATAATCTPAALAFEKARPIKKFRDSPSSLRDLESFEVKDEMIEPRKRDSCKLSNNDDDDDDDDDDDLDAPIRSRSHPVSNGSTALKMAPNSHIMRQVSNTTTSGGIVKSSVLGSSSMAMENGVDNQSYSTSTIARKRIAKRLEQARIRRVNREQEARGKLEIIPMFLQ